MRIWVDAGVGIVPFVARMKQLATERHAAFIDLFHPTSVHEPAAMAKLTADAKAADVRLHVVVSGQDPRLHGERIRSEVPDWREASIWFCGPAAFGETLRADFIAHGLPAARFHQELFELR
jgi:predicted ferric reductase